MNRLGTLPHLPSSGRCGASSTAWAFAFALGLAEFLAGCGGSSSAVEAQATSLRLDQVSVTDGTVWKINRPIRFTFSEPVDFDTVNSNTIQIRNPGGLSAVGEYGGVPGEPQVVVFQPACPTRDDFADAGLAPGGVLYEIDVASSSGPGTTVQSLAGEPLALGLTLRFRTPVEMQPGELFHDTRPGPAAPVTEPGFGSYLEASGPDGLPETVWFELDAGDGGGRLPAGYRVPINLYSDPATQVVLHLRFDQALNPSSENIHPDRLRLEFLDPLASWRRLASELLLEQNCAGSGASVRMTPVGVLPQGRELRVVVTPELEDIVGESQAAPLERFALMTAAAVTEAGAPTEAADEVLEGFLDETLEDTTSALPLPRAVWGPGGLGAAFAFDGQGGPGGVFDLYVAPNTELVFDTTATLFFGGDGGQPQYSQLSVGGRLDVRDLYVPASSQLRITGLNPARILAAGEVRIDGVISINGSHADTVQTVNTPYQPEPGGSGQGGGGSGGTASYITTQVTPRGGNGEGAFGAPNLGGEGGEAGWNQFEPEDGTFRRGGGGGGGRLGHDQVLSWSVDLETFLCSDQSIYGLDAESGFPGADEANSSQGDHMPYGGHAGPGPFGILPGTQDDFWGTMIENVGSTNPAAPPRLVVGELLRPTPGAGGGAGSDATFIRVNDTYPPSDFINAHQDKGGGGGGGAGALTIQAIGDIRFGPSGQISARGGHGGGGEHTIDERRVGGGSGGGSGGHVILQTAGKIDFSAVPADSGIFAIDARGGQGGTGEWRQDGHNNHGGATNVGNTDEIWLDAKHVGESGVDNPWEVVPPICIDETPTGYLGSLPGAGDNTLVVRSAGGDGGPGLVQLHVEDLAEDILYPGGDSAKLRTICRPVPHGYDFDDGEWHDQLLPVFGRRSMAQSRWIPLGEATVDPVERELGELALLFGGTTLADGKVRTTSEEQVADLPPLLTTAEPVLDSLDPLRRTLLFDASVLVAEEAVYRRNPRLLRRFLVTVEDARYEVVGATYREGPDQLAVEVEDEGPSFAGLSGPVRLRPRYFGVETDDLADFLPVSSEVLIEFEAAEEGNPGFPDSDRRTGFVPRLDGVDLNSLGVDPRRVRFLRFRLTFDIAADESELGFDTPRPSLEFLRMPYRF